ncbi:hypothetical protein Ae201684P_006936 [Aphanomyces euteiches]|nr:hypothetical protein Ae201684P_006936 [Aphanomyces euteiches]
MRDTLRGSSNLPSTFSIQQYPTPPPQSEESYPSSRGSASATTTTQLATHAHTASTLQALPANAITNSPKNQLPSLSCVPFGAPLISPSTTTESCGALRSKRKTNDKLKRCRCNPIVHTILKDGPSGSRNTLGHNPLSLGIARGAAPTEALCSITAQHYLTCALARQIKSAAASIGEDPTKYSMHSLLSGGATALFRGGASDLSIQLFGRWKSDAYKLYTRIDHQSIGAMAARMVSTPLSIGATATPYPWLTGQ